MVRFTLLFLLLCKGFSVTGQDIAELEQRNGFKNLKLGMLIDSVKGEKKFKKEFKEQNQFVSKLYTFNHPEYVKIGEIPISLGSLSVTT